VPRWKIVSGARPFYSFPGRSVGIGWARDLQRGDTQVTVNVCVLADAYEADGLPQESRDAIKSHGRSVINALLSEETLPTLVEVSTSGLERIYPREDEGAPDRVEAAGERALDEGADPAADDEVSAAEA
jgi:hypothetical protein